MLQQMTYTDPTPFVQKYAKAVAAALVSVSGVVGVLATGDFSTVENAVAVALGVLNVLGVYSATNKP
jgi:hypothetical protein